MKSLLFIALLSNLYMNAQSVAMGAWKSHLPYNGVVEVNNGGDKVFCANNASVFAYVKSDNTYQRLSTAAGFSDIGIRGLDYYDEKQTLVIAYTNSDIDFLIGNEIYNFPSVKTGTINGDKNIYSAAFYGDTILLSCGFGIVLFDIARRESPATYFFTDTTGANMQVNSSVVFKNSIYAATASGIFLGDLDESNLQDFSKWDSVSGKNNLPVGISDYITVFNNELYVMVADTVYKFNGTDWDAFFFEEGWETNQLKAANGKLIITQVKGIASPADSCRVILIDGDGAIAETGSSTQLSYISQADLDSDGVLWVADSYRGLVRIENGNYSYYLPNGPGSSKVYDMESANGSLYVAPGEVNASWIYTYNQDGFFIYEYGNWNSVNKYSYPALDTTLDLISVEVDVPNNIVYFASYGGGLLEFNRTNNAIRIYKQGYIKPTPGDEANFRVSGLAFDINHNLWISNYGSDEPLIVKKADGTWKNFNPHLPLDVGNQVGQISIDQFNTKWVQLPRGHGLLAYNDNNTIDDESDDLIKVLGSGAGNGNLHTSYVNCIAVDKQGEVWVGTSEGITVYYNPSEVFSGTTAGDATQPLVELGGYFEALLRNDIVNTIAVDGANRKWVGTNSGAFLISADGTEQLLYFNKDNSPLISNSVLKITIDGISGDVYFGTDVGIISYRYNATEGVEEITDVSVFPNPVREDYRGEIAISGLTANAEVKITDAAGRMIYETTALGGQAIWDGNAYSGSRAATGIYLVYASNEEGTQTYVAKILVVN